MGADAEGEGEVDTYYAAAPIEGGEGAALGSIVGLGTTTVR